MGKEQSLAAIFSNSRSRRLQTRQRSRAAGEAVAIDPHTLKHGNIEIAERGIVVPLECKVLTVLETATGEEDGQVGIIVRVGVAHVATVKHHRSLTRFVHASSLTNALNEDELLDLLAYLTSGGGSNAAAFR